MDICKEAVQRGLAPCQLRGFVPSSAALMSDLQNLPCHMGLTVPLAALAALRASGQASGLETASGASWGYDLYDLAKY